MPGDLNIFQRAMLQWNALQPYNAVHVLRLAGTLDLEHLRQVITNSLLLRGISSLSLDRRRQTFEYRAEPGPIEIRLLVESGSSDTQLIAQIEHELNTPFRIDTPFCPLRFFVLPERDGFILGATYFHAVADAESMILVLRGVAAAYLRTPDSYPCLPFDIHPARHDRLWRSRPQHALRKLLAFPSDFLRMRQAVRLRLRDSDNLRNGCSLTSVGGETVAALVKTARTWEVTVHDLLLALLMQALSPLVPPRSRESRRRNLVLGSIVNIRGDCGIERERTFGLFLGSFLVSHPVPRGIGLRELATALCQQTSRIKQQKLYLSSAIELAIAGRFASLFSTRRRKQFYHKYHPLGGGISNMSLDAYWKPGETAKPADYFRAVSTGPATPLVLSATTCGQRMTLAITYRCAAFSPSMVTELQERLVGELKALEGNP